MRTALTPTNSCVLFRFSCKIEHLAFACTTYSSQQAFKESVFLRFQELENVYLQLIAQGKW